jgi:hypothetical protein
MNSAEHDRTDSTDMTTDLGMHWPHKYNQSLPAGSLLIQQQIV